MIILLHWLLIFEPSRTPAPVHAHFYHFLKTWLTQNLVNIKSGSHDFLPELKAVLIKELFTYLSFLYFLGSDHFQHISWRHVVVECQLFQPWNSASQIDGSQWGIYTLHSSICLCCTFITMHNSIIQSIKQNFNLVCFYWWKSWFCYICHCFLKEYK
mgnify:CR=1 FL=1